MKDIYHVYKFVEGRQCGLSCIVGVKVAQSQGKITKTEACLRTQTNKPKKKKKRSKKLYHGIREVYHGVWSGLVWSGLVHHPS